MKEKKAKTQTQEKAVIGKEISGTDRVPFLSSLRFKILFLTILAVIFSVMVVLAVIVPAAARLLKAQTKNYMLDVTTSNATMLETLRKSIRLNEPGELKAAFENVGITDVDSSYAYVVSSDGTMLYHPTAEKIGQPVENEVVKGLLSEIAKGQRPDPEVVVYDFKGVTKYASYYIDETKQAILVVCADEEEILAPLQKVTFLSIGIFVGIILVISVVSLILTDLCVRPIMQISGVVGKMSRMDFSSNPKAEKLLKRKDETGLMSRSVASLRRELVSLIEEVQEQSNALFLASERLDQDASQTAQTVAQVENAVGDIATGATSQAEETQSATENVIDMGTMIEAANREAAILTNNSGQMKESSSQAMTILGELMQVNERTKTSIGEIYEQTNITNASAQKIKDATTLIASIAEETNLLSLNASIEAARAGEQGKGFAVVASQIQKLAEQSNESARQIDDITSALIQDSTKAVETMQQVREIMDEQSDKMQKTDSMFRQVNDGVENALESVGNITGKTESMDSSRGKVVDVVQNLSAIAQENAASSQETSASVTEVSNIVTDISENAAKLKDIAYELEQSMKKFRL